MKRSTYIALWSAGIVALHPPAVSGQGNAGTGTWGFVNARYDTRSAASVYTGYGWRGVFAWGGVVRNSRTGDAELLGGAGVVFRTGAAAEHWLAFATTRSGGVPLAQVYWLPTVRVGSVTTRAAVKWSAAYSGVGVQKIAISPLSMTMPIARGLAGGVAMELTAAEGAHPSMGTGLELRVKLPGAALGVNVLRDVTGNGSRLQLVFASLF